MDKPHLLGSFIRRFLLEEVVADRNLSLNTQKSYRDTIRLLLAFMREQHGLDPTRVSVECLTVDVLRAFLTHLEGDRGNAISTRNQRLTALHSLFRFISRQVPELVGQATAVQAILPRRTTSQPMAYLEKVEMDALLAVPHPKQRQGLRDFALLLFLYNTGARASEAGGVTLGDLSLTPPLSVRFLGKGRKIRTCPLWPHTVKVLGELLGGRLQGPPGTKVFLNVRKQPITRFGIHTLVRKVVAQASGACPSLLSKEISPHTIRHTTAVHLLRAGVDINTIRAWLGHASLETTNVYAEVDLERKAKALETCAPRTEGIGTDHEPSWRKDKDLMAFLTSL